MPVYVVIVYSVTLVSLIGYAASLWLRQSRLKRKLEEDQGARERQGTQL